MWGLPRALFVTALHGVTHVLLTASCFSHTQPWSCLAPQAQANPISRRIYAGSLDYTVTPDLIKTLFSPFGTVLNVDMPIDPACVVLFGCAVPSQLTLT